MPALLGADPGPSPVSSRWTHGWLSCGTCLIPGSVGPGPLPRTSGILQREIEALRTPGWGKGNNTKCCLLAYK